MKRKFFLRGLGMGILVTAVVLTISHRAQNTSLTDEEIMARAEELGMVKEDQSVMSLKTEEPKTTARPEVSPEPEETKEPKASEEPDSIKSPEPTVSPDSSKQPENTKKPDAEESAKPEGTVKPEKSAKPKETKAPKKTEKKVYITVKIERGMWSDDVARVIQRAGLVENAEDFDDYLCDQGYSSFISTGTYKIPQGATYYEIANMIAGH